MNSFPNPSEIRGNLGFQQESKINLQKNIKEMPEHALRRQRNSHLPRTAIKTLQNREKMIKSNLQKRAKQCHQEKGARKAEKQEKREDAPGEGTENICSVANSKIGRKSHLHSGPLSCQIKNKPSRGRSYRDSPKKSYNGRSDPWILGRKAKMNILALRIL